MPAQTKTVALRWFNEVINGRKPQAVDEIFAPEYVHHGHFGRDMQRDEVKQMAAAILAAYPDRKATVEDVLTDGDRVAIRWSSTGTLQAAFLGRSPTGRRETARGIWIARVEPAAPSVVDFCDPTW
jgi:predicted ester cyclase